MERAQQILCVLLIPSHDLRDIIQLELQGGDAASELREGIAVDGSFLEGVRALLAALGSGVGDMVQEVGVVIQGAHSRRGAVDIGGIACAADFDDPGVVGEEHDAEDVEPGGDVAPANGVDEGAEQRERARAEGRERLLRRGIGEGRERARGHGRAPHVARPPVEVVQDVRRWQRANARLQDLGRVLRHGGQRGERD